MRDYYYILGVHKGANLQEIQKAYKKLALKFHPDQNGSDPFFALHYAKITEAYKILSDDHKRFRYDKAINREVPSTNNTTNDNSSVMPLFTYRESTYMPDYNNDCNGQLNLSPYSSNYGNYTDYDD